MEWVDEACGFFAEHRTLRQTDVYLFRVAQMLGDYETHGAVLRRYSRTVSQASLQMERLVVARFGAWLRAAERSASTVRSYGTLAGEFTAFAARAAGWPAATPGQSGRSPPRWPDPGQDRRAEAVRAAVVPQVRCRRGPDRLRGGGGGPGGAVPQAGQDPVGMGPGRRGQDPGCGRPGQPVREARLRDHLAGHPARAAQHRRQAAGVLRFRLAWLPAVRRPGQDREQDLAAAAEGRRLGGHRLRPRRTAGQRLPAGVPAAHRPGRPVL